MYKVCYSSTMCSIQWFLVFCVGIGCLLLAGCAPVKRLVEDVGLVEMDLISNVPDSQFRVRNQRVDADPEEGWQVIGSGTKVTARLHNGGRYEIAVKPPGYREKRVGFTEPIKRYEFRFLASDQLAADIEAFQSIIPASREFGKTESSNTTNTGKKWAIVVGISDYQHRGKWGLMNLRYASKDAMAMASYFRSPTGGRFDCVNLLLDTDATVQNIKLALREKLREVQENDVVLIFWGGHGSPDPQEPKKLYLIAYDSDPEHMASTAYAMDEFQRDINNLKANNIILLADACHSAGLSDPTQNTRGTAETNIIEGLRGVVIGPTPRVDSGGADSSGGTLRLIFTSCEADEQAIESTELGGGYGAFTYFLLDALNGAADRLENNGNDDGKISLGEMIDYTSDKVKRFSRNNQHPDTAGRFYRGLVIGVAK